MLGIFLYLLYPKNNDIIEKEFYKIIQSYLTRESITAREANLVK